jgi:xeroderma pigmentosum group C-complementing protein
MPRSSVKSTEPETPEMSDEGELVDLQGEDFSFAGPSGGSAALPFSAHRRLGHPNAAAYNIPDMSAASRPPPKSKTKTIHESPYPVFWVEVLDEAHQKWLSVDPLVTETIAKPHAFEPPASDRENALSYVIAFEEEGSARDVTRRYTKAYNAKTRKNRVESTHGGDRWWRKTMRAFSRGWNSDLDQIEDNELAGIEAREPMPRNVADFKDHPYYALERHLRRNEILVSSHEVGKVAAGRDAGTPGKKKLESIFRRRDVKVVKSADAWYRLGREIKMGEQPVKTIAPTRRPDEEDMGDEVEERAGTNLYIEDQTEVYEAPPIVNGRVPKNSYGNLDIFVPSMVPKGGVHLPCESQFSLQLPILLISADDEAARAARILGIDYADALTGFEFRGRHGTAVLKGVVVASEYCEAMEVVIDGFRDERAQEEEDRRALVALRMWKRFLVSLRIKERVDTYEVEGEENNDPEFQAEGNDSGMDTEEYDDDEAGGFFPE